MSYVFNSPARFADEAADGFAAAYARYVRRVPGGVVRRRRVRPGHVAVVIGGGSGHYPAFAGLVGEGLAGGAAMGNVFASPSAQQICSVARAAEAGGGVLFSYGNYAGDALNFGEAEERLAAEAIACASVAVTDDVASARAEQRSSRRGIAGELIVFKVAGAAAEEGADLGSVARLARRANDRTRSVGVAFSGCTLPGAGAPLFEVPPGRMALGMGVHGEPGVAERDVLGADELGELLVDTLWQDSPLGARQRGERVALVLNGLGAVKYEELFALYRPVAQLLEAEGTIVVEPEVGEFVTSFAMAGVSLSACWLDDDLERLWRAPAMAPAFHRAALVERPDPAPLEESEPHNPAERVELPERAEAPDVDEGSRSAGAVIARALSLVASTLDGAAERLGRYDAVAGDGDHGIGMQRGASAAAAQAKEAAALGSGAASVLAAAGAAWADAGGGTSGALWGLALRGASAHLSDAAPPDASSVADAVDGACAAVVAAGKVAEGDKTMVDAMLPIARSLRVELMGGASLAAAWSMAAALAGRAAEQTAGLLPRAGRARLHGERSLGTPDPGAVSFALVVNAAAKPEEARSDA